MHPRCPGPRAGAAVQDKPAGPWLNDSRLMRRSTQSRAITTCTWAHTALYTPGVLFPERREGGEAGHHHGHVGIVGHGGPWRAEEEFRDQGADDGEWHVE